jgi:hypothetical protein
MREDDGGDHEELGELGEKQQCPDETEISSDIQYPEASDYSYNIGDEDDEDPRPVKQ